jgi:hypothetical protein
MDPETGIFGSSDAVPETTCLCYHFCSTRNTDFRYTFRSTYSVADMNHFRNIFGPTETSLFLEWMSPRQLLPNQVLKVGT